MKLNKKQQEALNLVLDGQNKIFITGQAGTGKTAVATEICKKLLKDNNDLTINVVTPSHKSKNVFAEMLRDREYKLSLSIKVQTIHRYLGYTLKEDTEIDSELITVNDEDKLLKMIESGTSDILIFEESSMIPNDLFQEALETSQLAIALGDLNQLKVVSGDDPILSDFKIIELTEQMRQEKTNTELSKAIKFFYDNISNKSNKEFDFKKNIDNTLEPCDTSLIDLYVEGKVDTILCYTNATVDAYNAEIQKKLYGLDTPQVGDTLVLQRPMFHAIESESFFDEKGNETFIVKQNGARIKVEAIRKDEHGILEIKTKIFVVVQNEDGNKQYEKISAWKKLVPVEFQKSNGLWKLFTEYYRGDIVVKNKYGKGKHLYSNRWSDFKAKVIFAKLPYAMTVHKAQGSSIDNVGINILDINVAKYRDFDTYNRLMYVALSRAKKSVKYII